MSEQSVQKIGRTADFKEGGRVPIDGRKGLAFQFVIL